MMFICKTPIWEYVNRFVGQADLGGFTLELGVDQLVKTTVALADSIMMMKLRCRYREVKNLQQCA
jgi:hypothetical protein